jgi:hypothetical protein
MTPRDRGLAAESGKYGGGTQQSAISYQPSRGVEERRKRQDGKTARTNVRNVRSVMEGYEDVEGYET